MKNSNYLLSAYNLCGFTIRYYASYQQNADFHPARFSVAKNGKTRKVYRLTTYTAPAEETARKAAESYATRKAAKKGVKP